ncbi:multidrug ABC transporter [Phenylobacterium sp. Root77]|uniref:ABC transporter ATP-binding protein n=1 Tax=unclassified Phenylobacterium TaxID=2640670 RepID=UPI0006FFEB4F|nr:MULTISPECIES: ABC transporter ATP-binding protein [unclassified Phenylobacterium]KQW70864.1 multidrug ABC transporter [Phenylobacterium sp. Root1277]KQW90715.1 multidrug ABC transporter [Phenylobacterium sp. Root1290]KRC39653.1 multidrug ABC transporter [Phenylobacterium sp. Root77]
MTQEQVKKPRASLGSSEGEDIFGTFDTGVAKRFLAIMRPYRRAFLGAVVAVLISAASVVAIPALIGRAVNAAVARDGALLDQTLIAFAGLVAIYSTAFFIEQWLSARLAQRVIFDIRRKMFDHFQDVSLSFMDKTHVGRIMSRLQGDVNALQEFLESSTGAVGDFAMLIGIAAVLISMDWQLGLLTLTVLPILIAVRAVWLPFSKSSFREARDASSTANSALAENINGVRTIQETRREAVNFDLYKDKAYDNFEAQARASWMTQIMVPTVDVLTGLAMAIVIVVGGNAVLGGRLEVGVMVAFIFYVQRFFDPVRMLSMQYTIMQRAMAAAHRIFEVLDVKVAIQDAPDAQPLSDAPATVEFKNVTFGYDPARPVLHDISLKVNPREVVALVGPTGSGKTSIIALTHRFYEVDQGQVLVGGQDVRDVTLDSLGKTIGMVLQEPFLFTGTIEDNIRYNTAGASFEDVVAAAKAVAAHDFIMKLPDGYQTKLGQRGRNISMGQRQLISFARALVADPQILILDEATANIDSFTEQAIQKALKVLFAGRTCIVIAHRLATIRDADRIVVLQQGRILEQGNHDELMATGGLYSHLYTSAHASFDDQVVATTGDAEFATRT